MTEWSDDDFDENGQWTRLCDACCTNHGGYPPGTFGGELACVKARVEAIDASHLADQVDAFTRDVAKRRDGALRRVGLIP